MVVNLSHLRNKPVAAASRTVYDSVVAHIPNETI